MSRSTSQRTPIDEPDQPQKKRWYVGYDVEKPEVTVHQELHWYEKYKLGYKPQKWNKIDRDCDDERYDLPEKEY